MNRVEAADKVTGRARYAYEYQGLDGPWPEPPTYVYPVQSTVARGLAARLGTRYLDTGAMYRAATVAVLRAGVDPENADQVSKAVQAVRIEVGTDPAAPAVRLDGVPIDAEVRCAKGHPVSIEDVEAGLRRPARTPR